LLVVAGANFDFNMYIFLSTDKHKNETLDICALISRITSIKRLIKTKGAFTLGNFARDFALSLHVLLNKNYLFSLLNVQASAKSRAKSRQCKRTFNIAEKDFTLS